MKKTYPMGRLRRAAGLLLVAGLALNGALSQAQAPIQGLPFWEWQQPQPTGFGLNAVQALNDSVLVGVGSHGTAVKTTNGGRSWRTLNTNHTREVTSVAFANAQVGWLGVETEPSTLLHYKAGPGRVLRTTDGGTTWVPQAIGEPTLSVVRPRVVAVSPTEAYVNYQLTGRSGPPNYFYLPLEPKMRHTVDGGLTWTLVNFPTSFSNNHFLVDPVFPTPTTGLMLALSSVPAQLPSQLLRTTNGGQTWQNILPGIASNFNPTQLQFVNAQQGFLLGLDMATSTSVLYKTLNAGSTWTLVAPLAFLSTIYPGPITFADPLHGLICEPGAFHVTVDGGLTWFQSSGNMPQALFYNIRTSLQPGGTGWAFSSNSAAIYRTRDFGQHFAPVSPAPASYYQALGFPDPTHGWALPNFFDVENFTTLLRTADRGATWQPLVLDSVVAGLSWTNAQLHAGAFPDADTAWVAGSKTDTTLRTNVGMMLRTTDGGRTWAWQTLGPPALLNTIDAMGSWGTGRAVAFNTYQNVLLSTRNGGQTWTTAPGPDPARNPRSVAWADSATVYVSTDGPVFFKSTTAGRSWQAMPTPGAATFFAFHRPHFTSAQVGYWPDGRGIWKTTTGGLTWQYTNLEALASPDINDNRDPGLSRVSFRTARAGWAFGTNDVFQTQNAGLSWTKVGYVGGLNGGAAGGPGTLLDRYNAFSTSRGIARYSEKFVQADTTLARRAYCAGESLSLPFATTGSFAGESNFVVQLSNSMGRFRPGQTRTVGSGTASPLAVTLPAALPPGSHYRLRIIQRDSLVLGADNGRDLLITAPVPAATLARLPNGTLQATLPAGSAAPARFEWERNTQPVPGQTGAQLVAPVAGSYRVRACSAICCGPWSAATVLATVAQALDAQVQVWPNPAPAGGPGVLLRAPAQATVTLFNTLGQVLHPTVTAAPAGLLHLSTTGLAPGIYVLRIRTDAGELARRLVVE